MEEYKPIFDSYRYNSHEAENSLILYMHVLKLKSFFLYFVLSRESVQQK